MAILDVLGLVGSVASGGVLSAALHGVEMFAAARKAKKNNEHELAMFQLELDAKERGIEADDERSEREARALVQSTLINADVAMHAAATDADKNETNQASQWVKNYKATTRPNILYGLFFLNLLLLVWGLLDPVSFNQFAGYIPTKINGVEYTNKVGAELILAVRTGFLVGLGFYFGDRGIGKLRGRE